MMGRIYSFFSSYKLSVHLLLVGALYYAFLFVWGLTSPQAVVQNIARTLPFILLYILFFINLTLCMINRWRFLLQRSGKSPLWQSSADVVCKVPCDRNLTEKLSEAFRKKGYRRVTEENGICFIKWRFSPLGNLLFHISFLLIPAGVIVSLLTRFEGKFILVEGYSFWGEKSDFLTMSNPELIPDISFKLEEVGAEFYEDKLFFTDLHAKIRYPADTLAKERSLRLKSGVRMKFTHLNIEGYGFAPVYVLKDKENRMINSGTLNLNVFPPPSEDSFLIPESPYRVYIKFYPDVKFIDTKPEPQTMNLLNPLYSINVLRGKRLLFSGHLLPAEECRVDDFKLSFPSVKKWGQFRIVRDLGLPFIWSGMMIGVAGILIRFFLFRREVFIKQDGNTINISADSEWFREIFKKEIQKGVEKIIKNRGFVNQTPPGI